MDPQGTSIGTIEGVGNFKPVAEGFADAPIQITNLMSLIVGLITIFAGLFFLIIFVAAGVQFITAGGDKQKLETARDKMTTGIVGLVIVIAAYALVGLVGSIFGLDILNPAAMLEQLPGQN